MVEPDCSVTGGEGQNCSGGSSVFCSPVRDGDYSEPGAKRWQDYRAKEDSGPGCEAVPWSETGSGFHEDHQQGSHDSPRCATGGGERLPSDFVTSRGQSACSGCRDTGWREDLA